MTTDEIHDQIQTRDCTVENAFIILEHLNNQIATLFQCLEKMENRLDAQAKEIKSLHSTVRCDLHP